MEDDWKKCEELMKIKEFKTALICVDAFIGKYSSEMKAYIMKGRCHSCLKEYESAIQAYTYALTIDP